MDDHPKYGARVYLVGENTVLIKQTIKSGDKYKIEDTYDKERHVDLHDSNGIGRAIQDALGGKLQEKRL